MRILFNHSLSSLVSIIQMLRAADPNTRIGATHRRDDTLIKTCVDSFQIEPGMFAPGNPVDQDAYADFLLNAALSFGADIVIPYQYREHLAERAELFSKKGMRLLTASDADTLRHIENKPAFLKHVADDLNFPVVPGYVFETLEEFEAAEKRVPGKSISIKPSQGIFGDGFKRVLRCSELGDAATKEKMILMGDSRVIDIETVRLTMADGYRLKTQMMLMPYFNGMEHSVDFAAWNGRLLGLVTRTKKGSHQVLRADKDHLAMAQALCEKFHLSGVLNFQTIETTDTAVGDPGVKYLLEMNSRSSGGVGMTALSGVNLFGLLLDAIYGRPVQDPVQPEMESRVTQALEYRHV